MDYHLQELLNRRISISGHKICNVGQISSNLYLQVCDQLGGFWC